MNVEIYFNYRQRKCLTACTGLVITYPSWDWSKYMLVEWAQGVSLHLIYYAETLYHEKWYYFLTRWIALFIGSRLSWILKMLVVKRNSFEHTILYKSNGFYITLKYDLGYTICIVLFIRRSCIHLDLCMHLSHDKDGCVLMMVRVRNNLNNKPYELTVD